MLHLATYESLRTAFVFLPAKYEQWVVHCCFCTSRVYYYLQKVMYHFKWFCRSWSTLNGSLNFYVHFLWGWGLLDRVNTLPTLNTDLAEQPWTSVLNLHWPALKFKYHSINHRHINRAGVSYLGHVLGQILPLFTQVKWRFIIYAPRSATVFSDPQTINLMFCWPCIVVYQYSKTNEMQFLYSVYYELTASTYFEHYLLIFRRRCTSNSWYFACVLCRLAVTR
jgi:hypothetical protein